MAKLSLPQQNAQLNQQLTDFEARYANLANAFAVSNIPQTNSALSVDTQSISPASSGPSKSVLIAIVVIIVIALFFIWKR